MRIRARFATLCRPHWPSSPLPATSFQAHLNELYPFQLVTWGVRVMLEPTVAAEQIVDAVACSSMWPVIVAVSEEIFQFVGGYPFTDHARSNSANEPSIRIIMRPAGPEVSIASVTGTLRLPPLAFEDVRQVFERTGEQVKLPNYNSIARSQLIEQVMQFGSIPASPGRPFLERLLATGALKGSTWAAVS